MLKLIKENSPQILKNRDNWVGFKVETKTPYDPNDFARLKKLNLNLNDCRKANISDSSTWGSFDSAVAMVDSGFCSGVGYAKDGLLKINFTDLDNHLEKCRSDKEKEELLKFYNALFKRLSTINTYMETSVSGKGLHLLTIGDLVEGRSTGSSPKAPIEIYGSEDKKFIIMTGHKLNDFDISDDIGVNNQIKSLQKTYFPPKVENNFNTGVLIPPIKENKYSDEDVLKVALKDKKFDLLWNDRWYEVVDNDKMPVYGTQHYADFALVLKLIFYTCNCPSQAERLFRKSPCYQAYGKYKWEKYERDIKNDIRKASETCTAIYEPRPKTIVPTTDTGSVSNDSDSGKVKSWQPDFPAIRDMLNKKDANQQVFSNSALISILKTYVDKYSNSDITYIPNLFNEDTNFVGATKIIRSIIGDNLRYSTQFNGFYLWQKNKFTNFPDKEALLNPLSTILSAVEHSVFMWVMTTVAYITDAEEKSAAEKQAVVLFQGSKKFIKSNLIFDVLKNYKGLDFLNDLYSYYQSPYINVENGVLNLDTKELLPHSPEYRQSKITNCKYEPDADCPEFKAMVERILPNAEDRKEIQKAFGLCLAKQQLPAKKVLILLVGEKDTGKTTLLNIITEILGDYANSVDNSLLMQSYKQKTVGPEMYDFRETLMITSSETNENDKLDTGRIKGLTGNTTISIRNLYSSSMDKFQMIGVIFIDSNHKPYIPPKESATWDRLRLFPFTCPIKNKDSNLKEKLDAEKSGIFNWLLEGLEMVLQENEIFETPNMLEFKDSYKKDMDVTEQFLKDCIEGGKDDNFRIPTTMLFTTYQNWCKDNGFKSSIRNKFYEEINKVYQKKKSNTEYYLGLSFTDLGHLYSRMSENTSQEFAEKKRKLLEEGNILSYKDRRKVYYHKSLEWFYGVKEDTDKNSYIDYCSWCSGSGFIPIEVNDFIAKIEFIKKEKIGVGYSLREVIENSKNIWDVYY